MTEKENVLHALRHDGEAQWVAAISDCITTFVSPSNRDKVKEGYDWFGVKWRDNTPLNEPIVDDISDWERQVVFPDLDAIDFKAEAAQLNKTLDRENKALWMMMSQGYLDRLTSLLGTEYGLTAFYDDPDATHDLFEALTNFRIRLIDKLIDAYDPEIVDFRDDYGTQASQFFSTAVFDEFFTPYHKRIIDHVHARGKIYIQHCCGKVEPFVSRFAANGADVWDSVQPCNDLAAVYAEVGDKISYASSMDLQKFQFCSDEEAREVVRFYIDTLGKNNNLLLWDTFPMELPLNPQVLTDEIRRYGRCH